MQNRIRATIKKPFVIYFILAMGFTSCTIGRFVVYNFADITDYKIFPYREIAKTDEVFQFPKAKQSKFPKFLMVGKEEVPFDAFLNKSKTTSFIIIQNDSIQYENYFNGYERDDKVASFSMAKAVVSILIGFALEEQLISSTSQPITDFIPEMKSNGFEKVTIEHLLQMTSGIDFNESYVNPFGDAAAFYYGKKLRENTINLKLKNEPGTTFEYVSGNTQLLGLVLERALSGKSISSYLQEKIWQPLQMEFDATWSIDQKENGIEKAFCCINARAIDFAKIGRFYLNKGHWNGEQLLPEEWITNATKVDTSRGSAWYYQHQWWLPSKNGDFMAEGILGQFIYVNPEKNLIIVRLGKREGKADWPGIFLSLSEAY